MAARLAATGFSLGAISTSSADRRRARVMPEVGPPDDAWEREAERLASAVMRVAEPADAERAVEPTSATKAAQAQKAMPPRTRRFMERRFGYDFANVRIHAGPAAERLCRSLTARAFTFGSEVYLASAQFRPETTDGRRLLAHELTHVIQQGGAPPRQSSTPATWPSVARPGLVRPRIQRRTAEPTRSDKTRTFTYPLKVYTIDEDTYAEAEAVANRLNNFLGKVFDDQTQTDYTVRFAVAVFAPPEPDILEKAFGINLHYRVGRKHVKKRAYRAAAQRWWVQLLRRKGSTGNLYLGTNMPAEVTKEYLRDEARVSEAAQRQALMAELRRKRAAKPQNAEAARNWYRKESAKLEKEGPVQAIQGRLDEPFALEGSRGTTFAGSVTQMRPSAGAPGSAAYQQNVRLHEFMHLLGLGVDFETLKKSIMSYPNLNELKSKDEILMPEPMDLELLYQSNPPSTTSVD